MAYANISNNLNIVQALKEKQIFEIGSQKRGYGKMGHRKEKQ